MVDFFLNGDLCQMSAQKRFLRNKGFSVGQTDVYPTLKQEDIYDALNHIWQDKVEGWWNYDRELIKCGICTKDEYRAALSH